MVPRRSICVLHITGEYLTSTWKGHECDKGLQWPGALPQPTHGQGLHFSALGLSHSAPETLQQGQSPATHSPTQPWALPSQAHPHSHVSAQPLLVPTEPSGHLRVVSDPASPHQAWPRSPSEGWCLGLALTWSHPLMP